MQHLLMLAILKVKEIAEKLGLIADYVVEEGKSGNWNYTKWNSGRCELWGKFVQTQTAYSANNWIVGSQEITGYPFPITEPIAQATAQRINTGSGSISYDYERTDYWRGIMTAYDMSYPKGTQTSMAWYLSVKARWK